MFELFQQWHLEAHVRLCLFQSHTDRKTEREVLPLNPISPSLARVREQHLSIIMIVPHWLVWCSYLWCFAGRPLCFLCFPADCSNGQCCSINETPTPRVSQLTKALSSSPQHSLTPLSACQEALLELWSISLILVLHMNKFWDYLLCVCFLGICVAFLWTRIQLLAANLGQLSSHKNLSLFWDYRIFCTIRLTGL